MYPIGLVFVMLVIYVMSAQDGDASGITSEIIAGQLGIVSKNPLYSPSAQPIVARLSIRKLAHVGLFGILGFFGYMTIMKCQAQRIRNLTYRWKLITVLLFCYIYGCMDEVHQNFVVGRNGRFSDTFIDLMGVSVALLVLATIRYMRNKKMGGWICIIIRQGRLRR